MKINYFLISILFLNIASAQVGIGLVNPTEMLEVKGDVLFTNTVKVHSIDEVEPSKEDFKLLARVSNSSPKGLLKKLDPASVNVAPMRMQNYTFINVKKDDVKDVDLQLSVSEYIVSISNFRWIGTALKKNPSKKKSSGLFKYELFQSGGTWHLTIGNEYLNSLPKGSVSYEISLIIYQKRFFKELPKITENLGGSQTGTAGTVPL